MAKCYVKAFFDWIEQVSALEDDEKGRLFVAILEYARSGEVPDMQGRESILFPVFKSQIDRDMESSVKQSENGKKGGRPRAKTESKENQNKPKETKRKLTKANKEEEKDKEKDKDKEEEDNPPNPPLQGVSPQLEAAFADWLQYKHERREDYKPTGLKALQTQIINNAARYGEQAVIDLIRECMGNNWRGIIFDKLDERRGGSRRNQDNGFQTSNPFLEMLYEGGGVP